MPGRAKLAKGRTIRKVLGVGWEKKQNKVHARENANKKIRAYLMYKILPVSIKNNSY